MIINEIGINIDPRLKQLDSLFLQLKKDMKNKDVIKQIKQTLKDFLKIKVNFVILDNTYNAFVYPEYKDITMDSITKIQDLTLEEIPIYVDNVYISFGDRLIRNLSNKEMTAVLLHEIGHIVKSTSNMSKYFKFLIKAILPYISIPVLYFHIIFPALFITVITTRTLMFFDHLKEYSCDKFALVYGYGDELALVMNKFHKYEQKEDEYKEKEESKKSWIVRIIKKIIDFIKAENIHPDSKDRIQKLIDGIKGDYQDRYPKIKKELKILMT